MSNSKTRNQKVENNGFPFTKEIKLNTKDFEGTYEWSNHRLYFYFIIQKKKFYDVLCPNVSKELEIGALQVDRFKVIENGTKLSVGLYCNACEAYYNFKITTSWLLFDNETTKIEVRGSKLCNHPLVKTRRALSPSKHEELAKILCTNDSIKDALQKQTKVLTEQEKAVIRNGDSTKLITFSKFYLNTFLI